MATASVLGCTGMVGAFILSTLRASASVSSIEILARRSPPDLSDPKVKQFVNKDTTTWASHLGSLSPPPSIIFSALATTRAAAGGFDKQYKLEHDLNVELAKAAKDSGTKVYVLISAGGANPKSLLAYQKMKGEIEENIKALDFEHTIILRPGLIAGHREENRAVEAALRKVANVAGHISSPWLKDPWAQEADVIAKAAVNAGLKAVNGEAKEKVWILGGKDIIKLGRTEWKD
jgi:hypothetical protein